MGFWDCVTFFPHPPSQSSGTLSRREKDWALKLMWKTRAFVEQLRSRTQFPKRFSAQSFSLRERVPEFCEGG